jgi:hypothetical protein
MTVDDKWLSQDLRMCPPCTEHTFNCYPSALVTAKGFHGPVLEYNGMHRLLLSSKLRHAKTRRREGILC